MKLQTKVITSISDEISTGFRDCSRKMRRDLESFGTRLHSLLWLYKFWGPNELKNISSFTTNKILFYGLIAVVVKEDVFRGNIQPSLQLNLAKNMQVFPTKFFVPDILISCTSNRFAINFQCGPNTDPRDDIALHLNFRFVEMCVVRNHLTAMSWGVEETNGGMPLVRGEAFEALVLCEPQSIKVGYREQLGLHTVRVLILVPV